MEKLYKLYNKKVQFFLVYTREIHPIPGKGEKPTRFQRRFRSLGGPKITQHKNQKDRVIAAGKCAVGLKLSIPFLLDSMDNQFYKSYRGIPAGTTVIDIKGKIAYWNRGAPNGCKPDLAGKTIKQLLANGGAAKEKLWAPVRIPQDKVKKKSPKPAKTTGTKKKETRKSM